MVKMVDGLVAVEAEPEDVGLSSKGMAHIRSLVQGYVDAGKFPGAISMVARRGKVVHFETYGKRDIETGAPVEPDTIFRIHSMTKPIASVALMMLYEEGRFQIDDAAAKYAPELGEMKVLAGGTPEQPILRKPERPMTIADLLRHTSGLTRREDRIFGPLYERLGLRTSTSSGTLREMIQKLPSVPLKCDPGAMFNYGISTDVVGYLVEVISGQSFDAFLRERIFEPLGMVDTGFHVPEAQQHRLGASYRPGREGEPSLVTIDRPDATSNYTSPRTYFSGAGGLVSTASDYLRFCQMLLNGGELDGVRILGPRTIEFMTMNHLPGGRDLVQMGRESEGETRSDGQGFGLGFAVLLDPAVAGVIGAPGEYHWGGAASTAFFISPKEEMIVIFMTQLRPSSTYPIRRELRSIAYTSIID